MTGFGINKDKDQIVSFNGRYRFLSNFWLTDIKWEGLNYVSVENAYQAAKSNVRNIRLAFTNITPHAAKKLGRKIKYRNDWEQVKLGVMLDLIRLKFEDDCLKEKLLRTGEKTLIEGNTWGDTYWGVCDKVGENNLGKILMQVRTEILEGIEE